ncbi:MAG: RluA family pseudouridine synthase [Burkholderiaceae bacterium]|nr:RluA family pseudouridine synthase [Burkholderiaceae bacterium]
MPDGGRPSGGFVSGADYSQRVPAVTVAGLGDRAAGRAGDDFSDDEPPDTDPSNAPDVDPVSIEISAATGVGQRVDRFLAGALAGRVPGLSRTRLQQWLALGAVSCAQRALAPATRLAGFETIVVKVLPREADQAFKPDPVPLAIVHEDADVLVIDKQAGLVVHPAAGHWRDTLLNGLLHHRPALALLPRAGIVHRLDKDTTGLMVVAASERALAALGAQLAERSMSRRYLALAGGLIGSAMTIDAPIGRDPRVRTRMAVVDPAIGKAARTHVRPLAFGQWRDAPVTLVECRLETGRTHQIRVHLQREGHALLGDALYGGSPGAIARQALHAWRLAFDHPDGSGERAWRAEPPADLLDAMRACAIDPAVWCDAAERPWSRTGA